MLRCNWQVKQMLALAMGVFSDQNTHKDVV